MSIIGTIYDDVTTDVLGKIGVWQWLMTLVFTSLMVPSIFNQYEDMFMLKPSSGTLCLSTEDYVVVNSSICSLTIMNSTQEFKCKKWHIKLMWLIWVKKSWLVFCDDKLKLLSTSIICRLGLVFGSIIFGLISDSFGRKRSIVIAVFGDLCLGIIITFCNAEGWFRLLVFLRSTFTSAHFYMGIVMICEIASNSWRSLLNTLVSIPRLFAIICIVPMVNSAPNVETISFISCLYGGFLLILLFRLIPESPQWLLYNRRISSAESILYRAAKKNGIKLCNEFKIRPVNHRAYSCLEQPTTCIRILTTYNIRVTTLLCLFFWSLYYFLWSSMYVRIYSQENVNQILLRVFGFIAMFGSMALLLCKKLILRYVLLCYIILTGVFTLCLELLTNETLRRLLSSAALATGVIVQGLILNITPRLFAINIRATMFGCCHATGQLGAMMAYLMFLFQALDTVVYMALEVALTLVLSGICILMLDVDERELPDVFEDMDYFSELSKPLRWATQKTNSPSTEEVEMRVYSFGSTGRGISAVSHSENRTPAQPIGIVKLWRNLMRSFNRKL